MPVQPQLFPDPEPVPEPVPESAPGSTPERVTEPATQITALRDAPGRRPARLAHSPAPKAANSSAGNSTNHTKTAPVWLQRISLLVLVLFCVYLGVLVMVLPWWSRIWDHNEYMQARPALYTFLHNGAVRGIISGLGLLDIWIGVSEAVHYRDYRT